MGRVVQRYYGAKSRPHPEEVTAFLHHRETGPHKSAKACNSDDLVGPVGIIAPILEEWMAAHFEQEEPPPAQLAPFSEASCWTTRPARGGGGARSSTSWRYTPPCPLRNATASQRRSTAQGVRRRWDLPTPLQLLGRVQGHDSEPCPGPPWAGFTTLPRVQSQRVHCWLEFI